MSLRPTSDHNRLQGPRRVPYTPDQLVRSVRSNNGVFNSQSDRRLQSAVAQNMLAYSRENEYRGMSAYVEITGSLVERGTEHDGQGMIEVHVPSGRYRHDPELRLHTEQDTYALLQAWQHLVVNTKATHVDIVYWKGDTSAQKQWVWISRLCRDDRRMRNITTDALSHADNQKLYKELVANLYQPAQHKNEKTY